MFSDGNVAAGATMSVVYGGKGEDDVQVDAHKELDGHYFIQGADGADVLTGGHLQDSLVGGRGDDTLTGGQGRDHLHGGGGHDVYVYRFAAESQLHAADVITGLGNDLIDFSQFDADTRTDGHQSFTLVDRFDGEAGELTLRYDAGRNVTRIMGDVNGDGHADLVINVVGDHTDFTGFIFNL
jgi:Ca2+-binding RTX toxin-like protein